MSVVVVVIQVELDAAEEIDAVRSLALGVEREQHDKARDLHEEVEHNGEAGVEAEGAHARHGRERADEKGNGLGGAGEQHAGADLADDARDLVVDALARLPLVVLIGLHHHVYVVHAHGEQQEGYDLERDEGGRHAQVGEQAAARHDAEQDERDARQAQVDLHLDEHHLGAHRRVLAQRDRQVHEHDRVADDDDLDVGLGLALQLVLDRALRRVVHVDERRRVALEQREHGRLPRHGAQVVLVLVVAAVARSRG